MANRNEFSLDKKLRDTSCLRTDILDEVKPLPTIDGFGYPMSVIANYFDMSTRKLSSLFYAHRDDFSAEDAVYMSAYEIKNRLEMINADFCVVDNKLVCHKDNNSMKISPVGQYVFSKSAVLRFALSAFSSDVAKEIRNKLRGCTTDIEKINELLTTKSVRDNYKDRIDAIAKVQPIKLFPEYNAITVGMAANYFGVTSNRISGLIFHNTDEFTEASLFEVDKSDVEEWIKRNNFEIKSTAKGIAIEFDNQIVRFSYSKPTVKFLPLTAVLKLAMLISESEIAEKIRYNILGFRYTPSKVVPEPTKENKLDEKAQGYLEKTSIMSNFKELLQNKRETLDKEKTKSAQLSKENLKLREELQRFNITMKVVK